MFARLLRFFGPNIRVKSITLPMIREYQQTRRQQISRTTQERITARTINYELQLLKGVMEHAGCWAEQLAFRYKPLPEIKHRAGRVASKEELRLLFETGKKKESWFVATCCAAIAVGSGCRRGEIRKLQLKDVSSTDGKVRIIREVAKNRIEREPRLTALAEWGLRNLLLRAKGLGATEPHHYLLPFDLSKSRHLFKTTTAKWDVNMPMVSWVHSWRKLVGACGMKGFRFHDLRHTFRTQGAEAGVPLEVMMAQLGHMDREMSLQYVHIQQRALDRVKYLIEPEQADILSVAERAS